MKPEHRHELKTNELAEWIASLPQWANKNLKPIIYVSVVLILVAGSYIYHRYQKKVVSAQKQVGFTNIISSLSRSEAQILRSQAEGKDDSIILLHLADNLRSSIQNTKNDLMAALALIKQGQAIRMELLYRPGTTTSQDWTEQINRAKACYAEALTKATGSSTEAHSKSSSTLVAMAKFGLGLCEEELGNFETARSIYNDIATGPDFEATTTRIQAQYRLATMDDWQQPVTFKTSEPTPAEPVPQIKLQPPAVPDGSKQIPESNSVLGSSPMESSRTATGSPTPQDALRRKDELP